MRLSAFFRHLFSNHWFRNPLMHAVLLTIFGMLIHHWGFLNGFEQFIADTAMLLVPARPPTHVVTVEIDDAAYEDHTLFDNASPLNAGKLKELLRRILTAEPPVIVVDIDTSDYRDKELRANFSDLLKGKRTRVVWFQDLKAAATEGSAVQYRASAAQSSGLGLMPRDSDGFVRTYFRRIEQFKGSPPSLPWQAALAYCNGAEGGSRPCQRVKKFDGNFETDSQAKKPLFEAHPWAEKPLIVFARSPLVGFLGPQPVGAGAWPAFLKAGDVMTEGGDANSEPWWKMYLQNRVVVLGGTFGAGRDAPETAFGAVPGLRLIAAAIENELNDSPPVVPIHSVAILFLLKLGAVIGFIYFNWRRSQSRPGIGLNLLMNLGFLVVTGLIAVFTASNLSFYASVVPMFAGLWIEQFFEVATEPRENNRALEHPEPESAGGKLRRLTEQKKQRIVEIESLRISETTLEIRTTKETLNLHE